MINLSTSNLLTIYENINTDINFLNIVLINNKNYYKEVLLLFKNLINEMLVKDHPNSNVNIVVANLNKINTNISLLETLINELVIIQNDFNVKDNTIVREKLEKYNLKYSENYKQIYTSSQEIHEYILTTIYKQPFDFNENSNNKSEDNTTKELPVQLITEPTTLEDNKETINKKTIYTSKVKRKLVLNPSITKNTDPIVEIPEELNEPQEKQEDIELPIENNEITESSKEQDVSETPRISEKENSKEPKTKKEDTKNTTTEKTTTRVSKLRHTNHKISPNYLENTLIISEKNIQLPFTISEAKDIYRRYPEKYSCLDEVIIDNYLKPANYYKKAAKARFKEAYNLAINSKKRKSTALKLALELFPNYNLHPAIITACKNTDELDIYLSCLEYDELNDFKSFTIKYDLPPSVKKNKNEII